MLVGSMLSAEDNEVDDDVGTARGKLKDFSSGVTSSTEYKDSTCKVMVLPDRVAVVEVCCSERCDDESWVTGSDSTSGGNTSDAGLDAVGVDGCGVAGEGCVSAASVEVMVRDTAGSSDGRASSSVGDADCAKRSGNSDVGTRLDNGKCSIGDDSSVG